MEFVASLFEEKRVPLIIRIGRMRVHQPCLEPTADREHWMTRDQPQTPLPDPSSKETTWPRMMVSIDSNGLLVLRELGNRRARAEVLKGCLKINRVSIDESNFTPGFRTVYSTVRHDDEEDEEEDAAMAMLDADPIHAAFPRLRKWKYQVEAVDVDAAGRWVSVSTQGAQGWKTIYLRHRVPRKVHLWAEALRTGWDCRKLFQSAVMGSLEWVRLVEELEESERKRRSADGRRMRIEAYAGELKMANMRLEMDLEEERVNACEQREKFERLVELLKELASRGHFGNDVPKDHPLFSSSSSLSSSSSAAAAAVACIIPPVV
ncbi:hypothetical protein BC829DRAFT_380976 [Chytridium lagenaria]|nr:hypothetical protein BC829DRAFT_380976 [Chytridium lagenaria]